MGETISIIADICGILGFLISIFVASKVYTINKTTSNKNSQSAFGKKNKQSIKTGVE